MTNFHECDVNVAMAAASDPSDAEAVTFNSLEWNAVLERLMNLEDKVFGIAEGEVHTYHRVVNGVETAMCIRDEL